MWTRIPFFFKAAGKWGTGSVIFSIALTLVGVYEHSIGKGIRGFSFFILASLPFAFGCYKAWSVEHEKLLAEIATNERAFFVPEIDYVIRDVAGGAFFIHAHVVNTTRSPVSIRNILLKNNTTGEAICATPFSKRSLLRGSVRAISFSQTEHSFSKKERRIGDELIDSLGILKSVSFLKGEGKAGWLCFLAPFEPSETECPSLSLQLQDALSGKHDGPASISKYSIGSFGD